MIVDGVNLGTLGVRVQDVSGLGAPSRELRTARVPGAGRALHLGAAQERERTITVSCWISVPTASSADMTLLRSRADTLNWLLTRESVQIVFPDQPQRYYQATLITPDEIRIPPAFTQRARRMRLTFLCPDPYAYSTAPSEVAFGSATQMPLGSARSWPVITIADPPSTVTLTYADHAAVQRGSLVLEEVDGASLVIDMRAQSVLLDGDPAAELVTAGDFFALDPRHAASLSGAWPTLAGPAGTATFRRAWAS